MTDHPGRIVIVGAGVGGYSAAVAVRGRGFAGPVVLVSDEDHLPYDRPPLSKAVLTGARSAESTYFQPRSWYVENEVELVLGDAAVRVDTARHVVALRSGREIGYAKLLLATGARARRLPALERSGIPLHHLRSLADSVALRDRLRSGARVVVIGAGVIGMEVAASALALGCSVHVVEAAPTVLGRSVSAGVAAYLLDHHRARGTRILCGREVTAAALDGETAVLTLSDGTVLRADVVLAGIGAEPATELALASGLAVEDGILVDACTRTSDGDVHAIGDVARFRHGERHERREHWRHAVDHAATAAAAMLGADEPYAAASWVWSDQFDLNIQVIGSGRGDEEIVRGDPAEDAFVAFQLRDGRLCGAILVNHGRFRRPLAALVARDVAIPAEVLRDPAVPIPKLANHVLAADRSA